MLNGRFLFKKVGTDKSTLSAILTGEKSFWDKVIPFYLSDNLSYGWDEEANIGHVLDGGRLVGTFERSDSVMEGTGHG